jgi:hypothetical protein
MTKLLHQFVEVIPDKINEGVLYISIQYCTAIHKCVCGCGNEVVTPLSPSDWKLTFNGETVSLSPSIGNWNFPCRSHYYITNSEIDNCWELRTDKKMQPNGETPIGKRKWFSFGKNKKSKKIKK